MDLRLFGFANPDLGKKSRQKSAYASGPKKDKLIARRAELIEWLGSEGPATLQQIADKFDVNTDTAKNDTNCLLDELEIRQSMFKGAWLFWRPHRPGNPELEEETEGENE